MPAMRDDAELRLQQAISEVMAGEKGPLGQFGLALAAASLECGKSFEKELGQFDQSNVQIVLFVRFECMFFFLFATSRVMRLSLPISRYEQQIARLQTLVIRLVVEMLLHSLEEGRKSQLRSDLLSALNIVGTVYQQSAADDTNQLMSTADLEGVLADRLRGLFSNPPPTSSSFQRASQKVQDAWIRLAIEDRMAGLRAEEVLSSRVPSDR
jgi:hypothetical protein